MEVQKSRGKYWIYFLLWLVLMIALLVSDGGRPYFWLALPGVCTHFSLAMDII